MAATEHYIISIVVLRTAYLVPNIVHYVYGYPLANTPMTFLMYISFLSVQRFIRPRYIFIHGDALPSGEWWNRTISDVDNIFFVNMTSRMPSHVFGGKILKPVQTSDIVRWDVIYSKDLFDNNLCLVVALRFRESSFSSANYMVQRLPRNSYSLLPMKLLRMITL